MPNYNLANPKRFPSRILPKEVATSAISAIRVASPAASPIPSAAPSSRSSSTSPLDLPAARAASSGSRVSNSVARAPAPASLGTPQPKARWSRQQLAVFKQIGVSVADVEKYHPMPDDDDRGRPR